MGAAAGERRPLVRFLRRAWAGGGGRRQGLGSEVGLRLLLCFQVTGSSRRREPPRRARSRDGPRSGRGG